MKNYGVGKKDNSGEWSYLSGLKIDFHCIKTHLNSDFSAT
jgi:hypothetical protein